MLKGNVTINIAADLDEDGTNALNQWFEKGTGGYTLTIQPDGTTQRLIRMLNVNTIPMIDFNGADRVTVNGGAGKYLIFRNTNSNNNNTGPVFRVYNNCSNITIQNCIIESNNGSSGNANITLGSGNNNGITIIDNFLGKATGGSTNLPRTCIYSGNSDNGNVTILNNNFYANYGYAITFPLIGDSCVIKGNSFYNNSGVDYYVFLGAIYIWGESGKHRIEDNWIGGQAPQCEGGNWNMATSATFQAIFLQLSSLTSSVSSIQNNVIRNINMTSTDNAGFRGIWINMNGRVNIGTTTGNIIGHISSPNSINISGTGSVEPISCGVNSVVSNNIIANITQSSSNPGNFYGIYSGGIVSANKIYKVGPTSSSANTNTVIGITCQGSRVINNQVTLGEGVTNNNKYVGLYVYDNNYSYYNSVLILGNSNGSSNSYGYYVTSLSGMVAFCYDNIFFNNRTGGTGKHYATGVYKSLLYDHYNADYNLLIAPNSAAIGEWDNTTQKSFSEWKSVTGQERFSMSNISSNVPYNTFFSESSGGNLNINNNSQLCWYVNGKGKQIATVSTDFDGNPRSTSVENGPTDIGSDEFNTATLPQNITVSGIQTGDHSHFDFAGRRLASLLWGVEGTPPENLTLNFYSGENPPNPYTGRFGKVYWLFTPSGGGGWNYSYNITLFYDPVMMGDIVGESNIRLCKSDNNGTNWTQFDDSPNTTAKTVTHSGLTNFSHFTVGDANAPLPVTLESFTSNVIGRDVKLGWVTSMEINNAGFDVEKLKIENNRNEMWTKIGFVNGRNNSGSRNDYSFEDKKQNSGKYKYRLKQIDFNGSFKYFELQNIVEIGLPDKYELSQNYPNPFNPATKIDYQLPFDSRVTLKIYDISGREINTIINSEYNTGGYYTVDFNASFLASGIYFYRFLAEGNGQKFIMTKKMLVIK